MHCIFTLTSLHMKAMNVEWTIVHPWWKHCQWCILLSIIAMPMCCVGKGIERSTGEPGLCAIHQQRGFTHQTLLHTWCSPNTPLDYLFLFPTRCFILFAAFRFFRGGRSQFWKTLFFLASVLNWSLSLFVFTVVFTEFSVCMRRLSRMTQKSFLEVGHTLEHLRHCHTPLLPRNVWKDDPWKVHSSGRLIPSARHIAVTCLAWLCIE